MNKTKILLAAVGGVALVVVLAAGYFAWSAYAARVAAVEGDEESGAPGLETMKAKAERLLRKSVFPGAESVREMNESVASVEEWKDDALSFLSRGDRRIRPTTDAAFKEFLVSDARRLQGLPGGQAKKTLDPAFDFGPFRPYISEGKIPEREQLRELQRKWDDIALLIEMLTACGVDRITAVELKTAAAEPPPEAVKPKKGNKKKPAKKSGSPSSATALQPSTFSYVVTCWTAPAAFVRTLNAFATNECFMVVEDFTIRREKDMIAAGLNVEKKEESTVATSSRRRRRGAADAKAEDKKAETEKSGAGSQKAKDSSEGEGAPRVTVVTDPLEEPPFETKLAVKIYDFRTEERPETMSDEGDGKQTEKKEAEVKK